MKAKSSDSDRMKRLRAAYFGLLGKVDRDLQRDGERRHELNRALVGSASIKGISRWQMQVLVMRVAQLVPTDTPFGLALSLPRQRGDRRDDLASPPQVAAILGASHKVTWTAGPEAFVRERVLGELRRRNWDGWWDSLWKSEASKVICAMQRLAAKPTDKAAPARTGFDPAIASATFGRLAAGATA